MSHLEAWAAEGGRVYDQQTIKEAHVVPAVASLNYQTHQPTLLDIGSGWPSIADHVAQELDCRVANVDIALINRETPSQLDLAVDIEALTANTAPQAVQKLDRFLTGNTSGDPAADATIYSDILNYVDFRQTLSWFDRYVQVGGFVVMANMPNRGFAHRFSEQGVKSNDDLVEFCCSGLRYVLHERKFPGRIRESAHSFQIIVCQKVTE